MHEAKGSGSANLFHEGSAGEIDGGGLCVFLVNRVVIEQRVTDFEAIERL
jgi:hypothetical protein